MTKNFLKRWLLAAAVVLMQVPAMAEDIDLFLGAPPAETDKPNVLIILDNTANWNTAFTNEMAALSSVFNSLPSNKFRVGLMMFTETGKGDSNTDGAYVRAAIRTLRADNDGVPGTRTKYKNLILSLDKINDKSNGGKVAKAMEEAYLYLSGGTPHAGNGKVKTDYLSNTSGTTQSNAVYALSNNALASKSATRYNSPIAADSCAKNFIIYISNGAAQDNTSDLTQAKDALKTAAGGVDPVEIPLSPNGSQENWADEWAAFMKKSSLGVTVYTLDIDKVTTGQGPGWTALLRSMADQSSGKYFDISSGTDAGAEIKNALNDIFSEIQSVNSVFASVSLPVSVNTQGTYLNQVFIGMFRPDERARPRWPGNLKQYKIGANGNDLALVDADSKDAINTQTGFITECARSYWTPTSVDTEWDSDPQGDCLTVANSKRSNYPDGNVVEKGAQAYKLRQASARTVKTCTTGACTAWVDFNNTNVSAAMLGASSTTERDNWINWAVGKDVRDEDDDGVTTEERRLSAHGDVVHSRPVAVNFGTAASPNVVVFYGGNDGWLRAVNGNQTGNIGTIPPGGELWAFMPPEFHTKIKRLYQNSPKVSYPNISVGDGDSTPLPKPYGVDGPITAYKDATRAFIYATMRRGGRAVYAFDVTTPASPSLKWKLGCPNATDDTGCKDGAGTAGMTGLAQTWSSPKIFTAAGYGAGTSPLLIFGGGYDTCEDYDAGSAGGANHNCTSTSKGHYVYVVDADTGALVKTFDTGGTRGIVADIALARDSTGKAIYGYTADLGGNVYRISFGAGAADTWTMTKVASLGCDTTAACTANRKFMFAPSVVADNGNYVVMLGSGDREKPLTYYASSGAVNNYFFQFTDKPNVAAADWPGTADCGSAIICKASLYEIRRASTGAPDATALAAKKGWYLGLNSTEQVVTSAITLRDVLTFSTHEPAVSVAGSCSSGLGKTRVYNVSYKNAASANGTAQRYEELPAVGLPPSAVAGVVNLNGKQESFCIGCDPRSPIKPKKVGGGGTSGQAKSRLYWYIKK